MFPALDAFREFNSRWTIMFAGIQEQFRSLAPMLEQFAKHEARCKRLEEAGWLPHPASPWHLLDDEELCGEKLNEAVEAYYLENWPSVRTSIDEAIAGYTIDAEAKATFGEVLAAHEVGLYRCVARTLFPEIERVSRAEIHGGAMDKIASQPKLQEAISNLCPSDIARDGIQECDFTTSLWTTSTSVCPLPNALKPSLLSLYQTDMPLCMVMWLTILFATA